MSFLKKLFGSSSPAAAPKEPRVAAEETYEGFHIAATPIAEGGQFRLCATITRTVDGAVRSHRLVRADLFPSEAEAARFSLMKGRQVVNEQGDAMFAG
ncbi:HlyU family transcriptional regulator [Aurantimonas sp. A2-1-M11]|uniref:HlyU family transcriptional regulator n=1 Tax=Aurantimonas sp. A2-1-M11 TaxID=3113712 RepID=UPI002F94A5FB